MSAAPRRDRSVKKKREISEEEKQEIRESFDLFDSDKDQLIDYHELKVGNFSKSFAHPFDLLASSSSRLCLLVQLFLHLFNISTVLEIFSVAIGYGMNVLSQFSTCANT